MSRLNVTRPSGTALALAKAGFGDTEGVSVDLERRSDFTATIANTRHAANPQTSQAPPLRAVRGSAADCGGGSMAGRGEGLLELSSRFLRSLFRLMPNVD